MARERTLKVTVLGDASSARRALGSINQSVKVSQGFWSKYGFAIRRAAGIAAIGVAAAAGKSIDAASDQGEALNKANVIFGQNAKAVRQWSRTTANAFGISRTEALESSASFGAMLDTAGLAGQEVAKMSPRLVELAADMASFNNQDPSEMLDRLRSGLAGEAEPLRRFGVFLSEAAIQTQAVKDGIAGQNEELTEAEKVQARYNLILEQTTKQQGDFARTSDAMPNQMRRLRAQFDDAAATLGKTLLPIATDFLTFLNDHLPGAIKAVKNAWGGWSAAWDQTVEDIGDGVAKLYGFYADFVLFFTDIAGKILAAAAHAFGWLPKLGPRIRRSRDQFNEWADGVVADLKRTQERFEHWGETVTEILANAQYSWEGFLWATRQGALPSQAAFSLVPTQTSQRHRNAPPPRITGGGGVDDSLPNRGGRLRTSIQNTTVINLDGRKIRSETRRREILLGGG